ncbi:MAG: UDP-2,3-diacylglucosamine diphosphatase [Gammaproteobacteria bacterium]|nr:UDP-2,3-diacylglucosamine diphosphatase [Gammaproteobacteria bacterium]
MKSRPSETLFISDLHLTPDRPFIIKLFTQFVNERAIHADALYILGDFFEYWIGDDDPAEGLEAVFEAFNTLKEHKVPVYFMHGNRDFLIGSEFEKRTHCQLIADPKIITINNESIILLHGDSLCTKDTEYQEFKKLVRSATWQQEFIAKPLSERKAIVKSLRETSQTKTSSKDEEIMDVEQEAVNKLLRSQQINYVIHGHTHRPNVHEFTLDNTPVTRIVLGDWYKHGSVLSIRKELHSEGFNYKLENFQ